MGLSVREALNIGALSKSNLIAGAKGLDRQIDYVDISETPDSCRWLRANEFLITTFYSIKDDLNAQLKLLHALSEAKGSGLAVKFGRFIGNVPRELLALADCLELPLISLPDELPFIDITHPLMTEILNAKANQLKYSDDVYRVLTKTALETNSLDALANELSRLIDRKVNIFSHNLKISIVSRVPKDKLYPIYVKQRVRGYISLEGDGPPSEKDMVAIRHTQTLAALQMINKELSNEASQKDQLDFLDDLLTGRTHAMELTAARAKEFGFSISGIKYLFIADIDRFSDYLFSKKPSEQSAANMMRTLFQIVKDAVSLFHRQTFIVQKSDRIIAILPKSKETGRPRLQRMFDLIHKKARGELKHLTVSIAVSNEIAKPADFKDKYSRLRKMLVLSRKISGLDCDIFWEDAEIYFLLMKIGGALTDFQNDMLGAIIDAEENSENALLLSTLRVYLECQGNTSKTAARLFIHRNTLRYRLQRIEHLLGRKLSSADTKFKLWLALKARDI